MVGSTNVLASIMREQEKPEYIENGETREDPRETKNGGTFIQTAKQKRKQKVTELRHEIQY